MTKKLVWFEAQDDAEAAITREKRLKKWTGLEGRADRTRQPYWNDLYTSIIA